MGKIQLKELAFARSGDKGDVSDIGIIAKSRNIYDFLSKAITPERVKEQFKGMIKGKIITQFCWCERMHRSGNRPACEEIYPFLAQFSRAGTSQGKPDMPVFNQTVNFIQQFRDALYFVNDYPIIKTWGYEAFQALRGKQ